MYSYTHDSSAVSGDGGGKDFYEINIANMGEPQSGWGIPADEIKIELPGIPGKTEYLNLAEVQVYIPDTSKIPKTCKATKGTKSVKSR